MKRLFDSPGALVVAWLAVLSLVLGLVAFAFLQPAPPGEGAPVTLTLPEPQPSETPPEGVPAGDKALGETVPEDTAPEVPPGAAPPQEPPAARRDRQDQPAPGSAPGPVPERPREVAPEQPADVAPPAAEPPPTQAPEAQAPSPEAEPLDNGSRAPADGDVLVHIPVIPPAPEQLPNWKRYRQPFNMADQRPRIAVIVTGLGLSDSATEAAIKQLPSAVTLSFSPYARGLEEWIALARARGHEVMLDLPMEPTTFPNEDPGPQALLTSLSPQENLDRLDWVLARGSGYVGLAGSMGSRFTASRESLEPILREVKERGLLFVDRRTTTESLVPMLAEEIGLPYAVNSRSVDERQASRVAIDARLAQVERIALTDGFAVAMAQPYPVTLERLAQWTAELTGRGFAVTPISALAAPREAP